MKSLKILFASIPLDGHFSPLTGLAAALKENGHDVRWYTQEIYADKLARLGIRHYPFVRAVQLNQHNLNEIFSKRLEYAGQIARLNFDLQEVFIKRAPEYYEDVKSIERDFPFDLLICDVMFTGAPFVRYLLQKPVFTIGVLPLIEDSKDLAPAGLGLEPPSNLLARLKNRFLHVLTNKVLFAKSHKMFRDILISYNIPISGNITDYLVRTATRFLQSGTPGFEYPRPDLGKNIRFLGAVLPVRSAKESSIDVTRLRQQKRKIILVTQGTVEKDTSKLIVPTLEAFKGSNYLVVATTGGSGTKELKEKYKAFNNIIVEDYIPFEEILPLSETFITNGGYGGVMLGIQHQVPLIVAGIHEGKNEINARVGYFKVGINLKTETPTAEQLRNAVNEVTINPVYKKNVSRLGAEFSAYDPNQRLMEYIAEYFKISKGVEAPLTVL